MSSKYDIPYRKDRNNHGGGLLYIYSQRTADAMFFDSINKKYRKGS